MEDLTGCHQNPVRTLDQECRAPGPALLGCGRVHHVNFDFLDVVGCKPSKVDLSHSLRRRRSELVDGGSKAGAEHDRPPIRRGSKQVPASFRFNRGLRYSGIPKNAAQSFRLGDAIPRVVGTMKVGSHRLHGLPEYTGGRLKHSRTPCRDGDAPSGSDQLPKARGGAGHVAREEQAENAHDGVE
jgi:hypothetical protein